MCDKDTLQLYNFVQRKKCRIYILHTTSESTQILTNTCTGQINIEP